MKKYYSVAVLEFRGRRESYSLINNFPSYFLSTRLGPGRFKLKSVFEVDNVGVVNVHDMEGNEKFSNEQSDIFVVK